MRFPRITVDPARMNGVPCIRDTRIPVATVIKILAAGESRERVLELYPDLEGGDLDQALGYAANAVEEGEIQLAT